MKVCVLGAGAVGLSVAARLSTVCEVFAVTRPHHCRAVRDHGFLLTGIWGSDTYHFRCGQDLPPGERFDYYIVTAKSIDTRAICEQFRTVIAGAPVVSLQNGIGNEEIIAEYTGNVIGGMIITGFELQDDGQVFVSVEAGPIKLGSFPAGLDPSVEVLVSVFRQAGMNVAGSPEIRSDLWGKTLYNCALNPLGAIMGVPYGALTHPAAWQIIKGTVAEAFAVCRAEGVTLTWEYPEEYLQYLRDVQIPATAGHHSSMLQDITRGKKTEIDFLNGAVVAKGARHGITTPVNAVLVDLIRFKESRGIRGR